MASLTTGVSMIGLSGTPFSTLEYLALAKRDTILNTQYMLGQWHKRCEIVGTA